ncbi:hypothetical protein DEO72_LG10g2074 [Vigna unguiculata]|uniref:Uncharacterized protein n=1 Tax=Vigna unguiculata TaxID=3917 RepID=A0A4D6ND59_VIGUN|nr:hypothetical protein DEO72_LG10g2074 [Vigna unguiculata]
MVVSGIFGCVIDGLAMKPFPHTTFNDELTYIEATLPPTLCFRKPLTQPLEQILCMLYLSGGLTGPRPIPLFGTSFGRTGVYTPFWRRVFGEPRPKTWL